MNRRALLPAWLLCAACSDPAPTSTVERGRELFSDPKSSPSPFACSTCHDTEAPAEPTRKPGAALAGATLRPSYWGGQENDLLRSINACRRYFMNAPSDWQGDEPEAEALYAFLVSLEPGAAEPTPFSVVVSIADVPQGDTTTGESLFDAACRRCHGSPGTADGALSAAIPALPDAVIARHPDHDASLVFVEKIRHGGFLGYGGNMPPFSAEVLSDEDVGAILEALGVLPDSG